MSGSDGVAAGIPERPTLYTVELRTARWPDMVAWYRDVLGLRMLVRSAEEGYALLAAGDVRLAILARPAAARSSDRWSLAFEVADLDAARATRRGDGTADSCRGIPGTGRGGPGRQPSPAFHLAAAGLTKRESDRGSSRLNQIVASAASWDSPATRTSAA